ncbi:MAG: pseudouridine synthase [Faecalibacterium sp.]|jgi:23S rRNA pseudouridine1911/1915/1917 synthase|nr:pseudouridine synthase [Faecalibacterium sp.]
MQILFENRACVVCVKPAGVESEEAPAVSATCPQAKAPSAAVRARPGTMPALLRQAWGRADAPVFCVHRLDTATGGVMIYAKTKAAAAALSCQIAQGLLQKRYLCVCAGAPEPAAGEMHDFLFKDSRKNKVFPVKTARKGAKEARLEYEVLETRPLPVYPGTAAAQLSAFSAQGARPQPGAPAQAAALCRVLLHTGRTHQIRVQFSSRKHPLFGDGKYGSRQKGPLGLWCESLTLTLPGETAPRTFTAPPPDAAPWRLFGPFLLS